MSKFIANILLSFGLIMSTNAAFSKDVTANDFNEILNIVEQQGQLSNSDERTITLAQVLMTQILTNPEASNLLSNENGHFVLDEANAQYLFGSLKDKALEKINKGLEKYYDAKDYAREKYDSFQEKLDERMPGFRNALADALLLVNDTLSKIDPKVVGKIITITGQILGAASSVIGAGFGVPVVPGLAISLATGILGNSHTISGALAGAKTLLDIAEEILRVDPNATPQSDEEKGNAIKKIAEAVKWVGQHYVDNYAVYKPDEVKALRAGLVGVGKVFAFFM